MNRPANNGIAGVLHGLLAPASSHRHRSPDPRESAAGQPRQTSAGAARPAAAAPSAGASRRGAPPGSHSVSRTPKVKVTVRLPRALIATYRDWSWEQRCHLSQLVERALVDFHRRRSNSAGAGDSTR